MNFVDSLFIPLECSLLSAIFGQRVLKFDRNKALASGLCECRLYTAVYVTDAHSRFAVAGALSGYFFSQAFLSSYLSQLERETFQRAVLLNADGRDSVRPPVLEDAPDGS